MSERIKESVCRDPLFLQFVCNGKTLDNAYSMCYDKCVSKVGCEGFV